MEIYEIEEGVESAIGKWRQLTELRRKPLTLTRGATNALIQMIVNIAHDPSPYWQEVEHDDVQRFAISILPNILADMDHRYGRYRWTKNEVSSWEIWHNLSEALDKWCPIPKDI